MNLIDMTPIFNQYTSDVLTEIRKKFQADIVDLQETFQHCKETASMCNEISRRLNPDTPEAKNPIAFKLEDDIAIIRHHINDIDCIINKRNPL